MLVAGVDSSTQSTKVMLCQADDGTVVGQATAPHPDGTECDPELWWQALARAGTGCSAGPTPSGWRRSSTAWWWSDERGAGDQAGPALERRAVGAAGGALIAELGGPGYWAQQTGSVPTASFTVTKLRWLAEHEPDAAARTAHVMLPHDWLTWRLGDRAHEPDTDRGDASGTGYFSPATGAWLPELAEAALGAAGRAAAAGRAGRDRGPDRRRRGAVRRDRGQHGRRARPGPGPGRGGRLHRHLGHRLRGRGRAAAGRVRGGGGLRRRHRPLPAAGGDDQRGPGADGHGPDAGHRRRPVCPGSRWPLPRARRA